MITKPKISIKDILWVILHPIHIDLKSFYKSIWILWILITWTYELKTFDDFSIGFYPDLENCKWIFRWIRK